MYKKTINDKRLNLTVPQAFADEVKATADAHGLSMAAFIRLACTEYIKKLNRKK